jgi:hypothetical protein
VEFFSLIFFPYFALFDTPWQLFFFSVFRTLDTSDLFWTFRNRFHQQKNCSKFN